MENLLFRYIFFFNKWRLNCRFQIYFAAHVEHKVYEKVPKKKQFFRKSSPKMPLIVLTIHTNKPILIFARISFIDVLFVIFFY